MRNKFMLAALAALVSLPVIVHAPAMAQNSGYDRDGRPYHDSRSYHGRDRNYRRKCGSGNGAVGTIAGGVGGALIGNQVGGGTLGTVAGGVGGALLGRTLDKSNTRSKNRC